MSALRPTNAEIIAHLQTMHAAGQGVWGFEIHHTEALAAICEAGGDAATTNDRRIVLAFNATANAIDAAPRSRPRLCLTCEAAFVPGDFTTWPAAVVILEPGGVEGAGAVIQALCHDCYDLGQVVCEDRVMAAMSHFTGTTMRRLTISDTAGHA